MSDKLHDKRAGQPMDPPKVPEGTFRFMDLPPELRDIIYALAIETRIVTFAQRVWVRPRRSDPIHRRKVALRDDLYAHLTLLHTCRTLRFEIIDGGDCARLAAAKKKSAQEFLEHLRSDRCYRRLSWQAKCTHLEKKHLEAICEMLEMVKKNVKGA